MENGNIQAALDAGKQLADVSKLIGEVNGIPVALRNDGENDERIEVLDAVLDAADARAEKPRRLKGTSTHAELASFIAHANRFKDARSAVFADVAAVRLTAVYDYHQAFGDPRWGEHRAVYACPLSRPWQLWNQNDGKKMQQEAFAQFIEDNLPDLVAPGVQDDKDLPMPADVLTMARNLIVRSEGEFQRSFDPVTGASTLVTKHDNKTESTKIPRAFLLGIPVFEAGMFYKVTARMRMEMSGGRAIFSYVLFQPEVIKRDAFGEVRQKVEEGTQLIVFAGSPEQ